MRREEFFRFLTKIKHSDFVQAISFWPREYCLISCISPHIISKNILEKNEGCNDFVKAMKYLHANRNFMPSTWPHCLYVMVFAYYLVLRDNIRAL